MADEQENLKHDSVGAWAKRLYFAARAVMDSVLRPHDLRDRQPCWLPNRAVSGALDRSVDGPHGWITESQPRPLAYGSDCVSSYPTRNSVTCARDLGP
jgi:hypothetical protein